MTDHEERDGSDEMERSLGRTVAWALPATCVTGAVLVGFTFGVGPGILVLAAGALVGVIGLLWASLRTLGGDAPLAEGLAAAVATREAPRHAAERKRRVLRGLKDLELEHSVGKIDDEDYALISARYREQAKEILREQDLEIEPLRAKAESIARAYLLEKGLQGPHRAAGSSAAAARDEKKGGKPRIACTRCSASNEPDAGFCKKCGLRIARLECSTCATSNEPDAAFCKKCGKKCDASLEAAGGEHEKEAIDVAG